MQTTKLQFLSEVEVIADTNYGRANVRWILEIEHNDEGVHSFSVIVPNQSISYLGKDYEFERDVHATWTVENAKTDTAFGHSSKDIKYLDLKPQTLEIIEGKFTLKFQ